jgi:hypothetical protein
LVVDDPSTWRQKGKGWFLYQFESGSVELRMADDGQIAASDKPRPRQRFAKGRRPYFMKDPDVDRLLAIAAALAAEVSLVRDRLDTAERLAEQGLFATPANIEAYEPTPEVQAARERLRAAMLERVFRILAAPPEEERGDDAEYQSTIELFA